MGILALSTFLAFVTGFAIKRGNICAVAAVHQWVAYRNAFHLRAFITGMCCAGLILAAITWLFPGAGGVSSEYAVTLFTVLAGVLFGAGAWLNRACVLGTIVFLTKGDLNYVGTLFGMFIGGFIGQYAYKPLLSTSVSPLQMPTALGVSIVSVYALVLLLDVWKYFRKQRATNTARRVRMDSYYLFPMIIVVGACCAILHALNGEWTYLATLIRITEGLVTNSSKPLASVLIYSIATFVGGLLAARYSGEIKMHALDIRLIAQRLIGGMTMGLATCMIPGGNESMMFSGGSSMALHAIVAYMSMTLTLLILEHVFRRRTEV
ncbi:hypothetical protein/toxin CptA [Pseudomonas benzenivorans]|nr:YeeE/YedE thiosulfate transporter family protein [Pseudomonas benzenivorans]SDH62207.1 hypothetical protein/toxin CptA [Pseudomonas benzenivorans]